MILRIFLFLKDFEPRDSYITNSYIINGVTDFSAQLPVLTALLNFSTKLLIKKLNNADEA